MAKPGVALQAAEAVISLLATMKRGEEQTHLRGLLNIVDFRGSDVRLDSGTILEGLRQPIPYPAIAWDWQVRQSYPWRQSGHINVLELIAFFNYLRSVSAQASGHHFRLLHVLDSRVCACVLAKKIELLSLLLDTPVLKKNQLKALSTLLKARLSKLLILQWLNFLRAVIPTLLKFLQPLDRRLKDKSI